MPDAMKLRTGRRRCCEEAGSPVVGSNRGGQPTIPSFNRAQSELMKPTGVGPADVETCPRSFIHRMGETSPDPLCRSIAAS